MRNRLTDELAVCGLNAVLAVAEYHSEQINRLFLREDRLAALSQTCKGLAERKRPYKICEDEELERICKSTHHQGVVAMILVPDVQPLTREDVDTWAAEGSAGVVLHAVGNDHNLGAIIRSAAFFDFKYIIISGGEEGTEEDAEVTLSTSAYRVAEGGMEHVTVRSVRSAAAFLRSVSRDLLTIGTDIRARQRLSDIASIVAERQTGTTRPAVALVIGNEETGLPPEVKSACSVLMRVPGTGLMESLNASQAAALFMQRIFDM
ncbi:MAG: RNA methyltransferase [Treponema sp.]|nr:RNA methyltransferase [Treponema sp.]